MDPGRFTAAGLASMADGALFNWSKGVGSRRVLPGDFSTPGHDEVAPCRTMLHDLTIQELHRDECWTPRRSMKIAVSKRKACVLPSPPDLDQPKAHPA